MNTLEHLTRITTGDTAHIAKLKDGEYGPIPLDVFQALYPNERWVLSLDTFQISKPDDHDVVQVRGIQLWSNYAQEGPVCPCPRFPEGGYFEIHFLPEAHFTLWSAEPLEWIVPVDQSYAILLGASLRECQEINQQVIRKNPKLISKWVEPSDELIKWAIDADHRVYHLLVNPSDDVTRHAIQRKPNMARAMDPYWLDYALNYDPKIIADIKDPTDEQCRRALQKSPHVIRFIKCPTDDMKWYALTKDATVFHHIVHPTEDMQWYAIRHYPDALFHIKNASPGMELEAVKYFSRAIHRVVHKTREMVDIIEKADDEFSIGYIPEELWTDKLMMRAAKFSYNYTKLHFCGKFNAHLATEAAKKYGVMIGPACHDIETMSEMVKKYPELVNRFSSVYTMDLIRANPECLSHIRNRTWEQTHLAVSLDRDMLMYVEMSEWIRKLKAEFF